MGRAQAISAAEAEPARCQQDEQARNEPGWRGGSAGRAAVVAGSLGGVGTSAIALAGGQ